MRTENTPPAQPTAFKFYTVKEIATQLATSEKTIRRLIDRGELRARRVARAVRIAHQELERYLSTTD